MGEYEGAMGEYDNDDNVWCVVGDIEGSGKDWNSGECMVRKSRERRFC